MSLDWLIVGGGIHGVHIAARLLGDIGVDRERLAIVDPAPVLLHRWLTCTEVTGMSHLRSPSVHHLDLDPFSLRQFSLQHEETDDTVYAPPFMRPALSLFNAHCESVVEAYQLNSRHIQDRVMRCAVGCDGIVLQLRDAGTMRAQNVVLAIGASEQPRWPEWAPRDSNRVHHIFDADWTDLTAPRETISVIGGGISAGQVAMKLVDEGHAVHLISRHPMRVHQFDSDSAWLGPKKMIPFGQVKDLTKRRELIVKARHAGSIPPGMRDALDALTKNGALAWYENDVTRLTMGPKRIDIQLNDETVLSTDRVLLATGFCSRRPGGAMVDGLIESAALPCSSCGYPIVDSALRWHPRIYVSGPLAELELGPVSRNIAGARRAGDRLVAAARRGDQVMGP